MAIRNVLKTKAMIEKSEGGRRWMKKMVFEISYENII
jgi:hypothetical protein